MSKPKTLAYLCEKIEKLGFDYLVESSDHLVIPETINSTYPYSEDGKYPQFKENLEQLTTLSFIAAASNKIGLLSSIMVISYRPLLLTTKILSTIDYLSEGRLTVGVGVEWLKEEFDILGIPYEERGHLADEYLQALRELWLNPVASFNGKFCNFSRVSLVPRPVQDPHPPIWVGGESIWAMKRAARYGDGWLPIGANPSHLLDSLERMNDAVKRFHSYVYEFGRHPEEFEIGYIMPEYNLTPDSQERKGLFTGPAAKLINTIRVPEDWGDVYRFQTSSGNSRRNLGSFREILVCRITEHSSDSVRPKG